MPVSHVFFFFLNHLWKGALLTVSSLCVGAQASPASESVLERGLVAKAVNWKDVVREEKRYWAQIQRTFKGEVLGYVTPVSFNSSTGLLLVNNTHICIAVFF